jgi:hypothetical protein
MWFGTYPATYMASLQKGAAGPSNGDGIYIIAKAAYQNN